MMEDDNLLIGVTHTSSYICHNKSYLETNFGRYTPKITLNTDEEWSDMQEGEYSLEHCVPIGLVGAKRPHPPGRPRR